MIAVIDYGMGNLRSVQKALEVSGGEALITSDPKKIREAKALVLPGVGAFGAAVTKLQKEGLVEVIRKEVQDGKPFLGICLGLQLLFPQSDESPGAVGLGILPGRVKSLTVGLKIPHMGWNQVQVNPKLKNWLFKGIEDKEYFYFDHTFVVDPQEASAIAATTDYGVPFVCAVHKDNIYGVQFHPEKSQTAGLKMMENFVQLAMFPKGAFKLLKKIKSKARTK